MPGQDEVMKLIIVSKKDDASLNIFSHLLCYGYKEISEDYYKRNDAVIAVISEDSIFADHIEKRLKKI